MPTTAPPPPPPNIPTLKASFLATQVRLLSTPLTYTSTTTLLPEKHLTPLLKSTNTQIRAHNRAVFPPQAQRHIAEQIETLFWNEVVAEREAVGKVAVGETVVRRDVDLLDIDGLGEEGLGLGLGLPDAWSDTIFDDGEGEEDEQEGEDEEGDLARRKERREEEARYTALRAKLASVRKRRDEAARKVQRYRQLQALLRPYENARETIQPNLVTKDGELSREMEKMKILLARVTARMGQSNGGQRAVGSRAGEASVPSFRERVVLATGGD